MKYFFKTYKKFVFYKHFYIFRPLSANQKRKQQFANMTSKIQIIPSNRQGQLNTTFLATLPGVLKLAEIILCFVAFILAICSDRRSTSASWTDHISFECMIVVSALLLAYVAFPHLTLKDEATREGLIVVELLFYGINTLFFFIAVFLMIHVSASWTADGKGAAIMCAVSLNFEKLNRVKIFEQNVLETFVFHYTIPSFSIHYCFRSKNNESEVSRKTQQVSGTLQ